MGIINSIKNDVAKQGTSKEKIFYVKQDSKVRVRFLQELDDGQVIVFHDSYEKKINIICKETFGKDCEYCSDEDLRTRQLYAWSVWNYDTKRVEIMLYAVNNCTPVASFISMSEQFNTILDRDFVISRTGKATSTTYTVIPMDKQRFRNEKAKPFTKSAMLKLLLKSYPYDTDYTDNEEDEEVEEKPKTRKKASSAVKKEHKYATEDDEGDIDELEIDEMQEMLDAEDVDEEDFLDYNEVKSLKKFKALDKKKFKKLIKNYLKSIEDDEEEDDD